MRDFKDMVQNCALVSGGVPIVLNGTGITGDWVSMKNYGHLSAILFKDSGTAGSDPTITMFQAKTVAGGSVKIFNFREVWIKRGTTTAAGGLAALTATTDLFTRTAASGYATGLGLHTDTTSAEDEAFWVVEVNADDLDVDNNFDCVKMVVDDVSDATALACIFYVLSQPRFLREHPPSAIVN